MSESTQWAVLMPVVLLLVLGLVQFGVWLHARNVAAQAASAVADLSAAGADGATEAGLRIATGGGLQQVSITIRPGTEMVLVTVRGRAPVFFDVGQGVITETAVIPREVLR